MRHHPVGQRRQKALGQQRQIRLIDLRTDLPSLIQAHVRHKRPRLAIIAIHRHRAADLIQRLKQVAAGCVQLAVDGVGAVSAAALQHTHGLVPVYRVVVIPAADNDRAAQRRHTEAQGQRAPLFSPHARVVARQSRLGIDDALK
ncbi:hypothetical protein D3C72_1922650 [compost metagenome]